MHATTIHKKKSPFLIFLPFRAKPNIPFFHNVQLYNNMCYFDLTNLPSIPLA